MGIRDWFVSVAIKKAASRGLKAAIAASAAFIPVLAKHGVKVEIDEATLSAALTAIILGGYEFARNFLKQKEVAKLP